MLIVTGHIYVSPSALNACLDELRTLAASARQRERNISYDAAMDCPPRGRLLVSERWVEDAALAAHLNAADTIAFIHRWEGRMRGDIRKYDASNERRLTDQ